MKFRDINWGYVLLTIWIIALLAGTAMLLVSCAQIIYTDPNGATVQVNTLLKDIDFDELKIKELVEMKRYTGDSKNVDVYTTGVIVKTSDSNE